MDLFEQLVLGYLAKDPYVFLSPQYSIKGGDGSEWSCPDFVALNFMTSEIYVVEVSSAANVKHLAEKVADLENQWGQKLKAQLLRHKVLDGTWSVVVRVFIREDCKEQFFKIVGDRSHVRVEYLEDISIPWKWK
jgi:hypothetical protein